MTSAGQRGRARAGEHAEEELSVHFLPDYTDANPYQSRLAEALTDQGVRVTTSGGGGGPLPILAAVLGDDVPDVVHVHFLHQFVVSPGDRLTGTLSLLLGIRTLLQFVLLRALGVSLVWTAHDIVEHERRAPRIERVFKHVFLRFLFTRIIVHCSRARDVLGDYPDEVTRAEARERLDLPADAFVFGFFGTIRAYKDVPRLVETFDRVADDDHRLLVAGNPRTQALEREVEEAAAGDDRIRTVFEYVPDDEVQLYLRAADVVVLPFRTEERSMLTSGSAVLAMGFGRPVIAPDVGCVGAVVDEGEGFSYPSDADEGLDLAMRRAADADNLVARGRQSRAVVSRRTWDRAATLTSDVYTERV